jgi:hypothetical protein
MAVRSLADGRPVIFVCTAQTPAQLIPQLLDQGLGTMEEGLITFVDGYTRTVGIKTGNKPVVEYATCTYLNTLSVAIS